MPLVPSLEHPADEKSRKKLGAYLVQSQLQARLLELPSCCVKWTPHLRAACWASLAGHGMQVAPCSAVCRARQMCATIGADIMLQLPACARCLPPAGRQPQQQHVPDGGSAEPAVCEAGGRDGVRRGWEGVGLVGEG